jgi:hypothetical protein
MSISLSISRALCAALIHRIDSTNKPGQISTEAVLKSAIQCPDGALRQPDKKKPCKRKTPTVSGEG